MTFSYNGTNNYTPPTGVYKTLVKNAADNSYTLTLESGVKYDFHPLGVNAPNANTAVLKDIADRNNNALAMQYASNKITSVTDNSRTMYFAYDGSSRITAVTDPAGNTYSCAYDTSGGNNLIIYYPHSANAHIGYILTGSDVLTTKYLEFDGSAWKYRWDYEYYGAVCTKVTYPDATYDTMEYLSSPMRNSITDARGRKTTWEFDAAELITKITDANGSYTTYGYDSNNKKTRQTDARNQSAYFAYDGNGNMTRETKPGNIITDYVYNSGHQVTSVLDALNREMYYYYDANGNLTRTHDDANNEVAFAYDAANNRTSMTDANENTIYYEYDDYGQLTLVTDAEDNVTGYAYDANGNRASMTDGNNNTTTFEYDAINRLTKITDHLDNYVTYEYDRIGNRTKVTDQEGKDTTYEYNWRGQVTRVADALNQQTNFAYDQIGNMTRMTDARTNDTYFAYEFGTGCGCGGSGSAVTRITYPNNDYETFKYDANGNLTLKTDCNGAQIQYAYDALNQLTQKTYPGPSTATFAYDKIGNMTSAVDSDSSISFAHDNLYRMTSTTQQIYGEPSRTIEYAYDPAGNRTTMTGPNDIANAYTYTLINQVASITDVYNNATNYYYDDGGRLTLRTYGNGTKAEYSYDDANRMTLLSNKKSHDSVLSSFSYELDKTGNRTKRTAAGSAMTAQALKYTYDNIYEITEVYQLEPTTETLETFSYDAVGNRTTDDDYSNYSYNTNNQLTSYDSITFNYDKNGNLTRKTQNGTDITTYSFDYENKITRIDCPDETYSAYKYDALGRRVEKRDREGNANRYVYDGQNFIAEYDGDNVLVASNVQGLGIDDPISMYRDGENYWYHSDALGSICKLTDSDEATARSYDYSAFGKIISESGSLENPFTYTAREYDFDSGLYYYRARYYDASVGRFLGRDPMRKAYENLYAYVLNNCTNKRDPSGLDQDFDEVIEWKGWVIWMRCTCPSLFSCNAYQAIFHLKTDLERSKPTGCWCWCYYNYSKPKVVSCSIIAESPPPPPPGPGQPPVLN